MSGYAAYSVVFVIRNVPGNDTISFTILTFLKVRFVKPAMLSLVPGVTRRHLFCCSVCNPLVPP